MNIRGHDLTIRRNETIEFIVGEGGGKEGAEIMWRCYGEIELVIFVDISLN